MNTFRLLFWGAALSAVLLVTGCGGADTMSGGRGDGNIPIGRLKTGPRLLSATESFPGQAAVAVLDGQGTLWAPHATPGNATITIVTEAGTTSLPIVLGTQQSYILDGNINTKPAGCTVTGLAITLTNGSAPIVGNSYQINVVVSGTNVSGLTPNVWVDNGVGYIDANHRFVAGTVGTGAIRAELFGVMGTLPITVH